MSEINSLKQLYKNAKNTFDLDLFLYTGLPIVGRDGLVQIVADVIFDRLVQTCEGQDELEDEMMHPSILAKSIWEMKRQFLSFFIIGIYDGSGTSKVQHLGAIYGSFFYTQDWQFRENHYNNEQCGYYPSGRFVKRLCEFDSIDFTKFQIYRFAYSQRNIFILSHLERAELLQHTLDFINSN